MVAAGIRSILNFAPAVVTVGDGVTVRKVDLATELQILAYYEQRNAESLEETGTSRDASAGRDPDHDRDDHDHHHEQHELDAALVQERGRIANIGRSPLRPVRTTAAPSRP